MKSNPIYLNDILHLSDEQIRNTKLRFIVESKRINFDPYVDIDDPIKQNHMNLRNVVHNPSKKISFKKGTIAIGFIKIDKEQDYWLMTGIMKVIRDEGYSEPAKAEYLTKKYNYRLVVKHHKNYQNGIRNAKGFIETLEVVEIWNPDKGVSDKSFPGYKNVRVSYNELMKKLEISDEWNTALSLRKGVYLITDKATGKLYVGSAYGSKGILGRWQTYLKSGYDKNELENGKYPNKKLKELVQKEGMKYIKNNFQYSILETFTEDVPDDYIILRESWWKDVLVSRTRGYNSN